MTRSVTVNVILGMLGVVLVASLATFFLLPPIVERVGMAQIQNWASSRGVDVQYGSVEWRAQGLLIKDLRVRHLRAKLRVPQVTLDLSPVSYMMGSPLVDGLHFESPVLQISRSHSVESVSERTPGTHSVGPHWPTWLRRVGASTLRVELYDDVEKLLSIQSEAWAANMVAGEVSATGQVRVESARLKAPLTMDCEMAFAGSLRRGALECDGGTDRSIRVLIGEDVVRFGALSMEVNDGLDKTRFVFSDVSFERNRVLGSLPHVEISRTLGETRTHIERGVIRIERAKTTSDLPPQTPLIRGASPTDLLARVTQVKRRLGSYQTFSDVINRLTWAGVTIETPWLPRVTSVSGHLTREMFQVQAVVAGGRVRGEVTWSPGLGHIEGAHLTVSKLQLGPVFARRLPALAPGRSSAGRVDGEVSGRIDIHSLDTFREERFLYDADLAWLGGRVELAGVAERPITGIALQMSSGGDLSLDEAVFRSETKMTLGAMALRTNLKVSGWSEDPVIDLSLQGTSMPCEAALSSLPVTLLGPYERVAAVGQFGPKVELHWPLQRPKRIKLKFRDIIRSCRVTRLNTHPSAQPPVTMRGGGSLPRDDVDWMNRAFIFQVTEGVEDGANVRVGPGTADYIPLGELPKYVGAAAYLSEEIHFYKNRPIDPGLIGRALRLNLEHRRFVYGGSTVTQQLVKNLFLTRTKTLARKIQEILVAARITQVLSRERVLELYLNCIEFGPNVFGIGRAARFYFQKDARRLTPREAVFLAMLKPAPRRGAWMKRRGYTPKMPYWGYRAEEIMGRLVDKGYLTQGQADAEKPYSIRWNNGQYVSSNL